MDKKPWLVRLLKVDDEVDSSDVMELYGVKIPKSLIDDVVSIGLDYSSDLRNDKKFRDNYFEIVGMITAKTSIETPCNFNPSPTLRGFVGYILKEFGDEE